MLQLLLLGLLSNIRKSKGHMDIHCSAGVTSTDLVGELPGYSTVWYHPSRIANILSLSRVKKHHRVTFNSLGGNEFTVHKKNENTHRFVE
jgi:hypothetical protein